LVLEFSNFMRGVGLIPGDVVADARWHRCPTEAHPRKRNGSWKLSYDGRIGWAMNWEFMSDVATWRPEREAFQAPVDQTTIARKRSADRRALIRATSEAREFYRCCDALTGGHPYLADHKLDMTGCRNLRVDVAGWLVVPVMMEQNVISVQRISPEGNKKFWPGASVKGGSYVINRPQATVTVLCEGLATGLAIFAAAPLARVIVAFNAGNLSRVQIPRLGLAVIAADNDHATADRLGRNPGIDAATAAADAFGCGIAVPTGITGSDWSDYRIEKYAERVKSLPARSFKTEGAIRREVDAEIALIIQRNARFVRSH
jgi:putative DNA primase/helicase